MTQSTRPPEGYTFSGKISRPVLENYLSRSITMVNLLQGAGCLDDNVRMLIVIGARFIGRSLMHWGRENELAASLFKARAIADRLHRLDPQMILQGGIFEIVTRQVETIRVPDWVFNEFGLPVQNRAFSYEDMLFEDGLYFNHWDVEASVPDITRRETQMWIVFLAGSFMDSGIEAIHFGQMMLIGRQDPEFSNWWEVLNRIRQIAIRRARRQLVLCDAHVSSGVGCYGLPDDASLAPGGYRIGERLLLDFHALPLRIKEVPGQPYQAELQIGHLDVLYGRSLGGIAPSGWACDSLPYLVEYDNWGSSGHGGESVTGKIGDLVGISDRYWIWGYDEICWFAHQPEDYRNAWLRYAWDWVKEHDACGFVEMPGMRGLADPVGNVRLYQANTPSLTCPEGFNQEFTIRAIWSQAFGQ
jgi:hypothetical protein